MKKIIFSATLLLATASAFAQVETVDPINLSIAHSKIVAPHEVKHIRLSTGVTLEYVEQGNKNGTPVIFLHGITDSWHSFESVLAHLPASVHGFAITQRGHGGSEKPLTGYTPKKFAADVAAFIQQKKLGTAIIVGHSMGGVHAQQFALDFPNLTRGIVLVSTDPCLLDNEGMPEFYRDVKKLEGAISWEFMDEFQKATLAKPIDSTYYHVLVEEGTKTPVRVFQAALKGILQVDFVSELKNIQCPALILWGDKDAFCFRKGQDLMATNIREAKLMIYEGIGHALHWEAPERFATDLLQFIESLSPSGRRNK